MNCVCDIVYVTLALRLLPNYLKEPCSVSPLENAKKYFLLLKSHRLQLFVCLHRDHLQ
jgi:hypothetical protein